MKELTTNLQECFEQSLDLYCQQVEEGNLDLAAAVAAHAENYLEALYLAKEMEVILAPSI